MRNGEKIYREISNVNDEYIPLMKKNKGMPPLKAAAAALTAAAVAGVFAIGGIYRENNKLHFENTWQDYKIYSDYIYGGADIFDGYFDGLPKIPILSAAENGVEASHIEMAFDISELDNGNPWNENSGIASLPVFKNSPYPATPQWPPCYYSEEELTEIAEKAAKALGAEIIESEFSYDYYIKANPSNLNAVCSGEKYGADAFDLSVSGKGDIAVGFGEFFDDEKCLPLPDGYSFTYYDTSEEEAAKTLSYLIGMFKDLLQFENPVMNIYRSDYSFSGEYNHINYSVYNGSDDPVQNLLNFFFDKASFAPSITYASDDKEEIVFTDKLSGISRSNPLAASECMGDYPIITPQEAKAMLINSNVPPERNNDWYLDDGKIDDDDIKRIELIYNTGNSEFFAPYYQFAVEVQCDGDWITDKNLKSYCMYIVPAVKSEYLVSDINPDLDQSVVAPFFASEIFFPDGSVLRKAQAVSAPFNGEYPVLEYDFGFLRNESGADTENGGEWFKIKAGDRLENGLYVESASYFVAWYGGETHFASSAAALSGSAEFYGVLRRAEEDGEGISAGDLYFYPDKAKNGFIPSVFGLPQYGSTASSDISDKSEGIYLGNIESAYMSDYLKNVLGENESASLTLTLENLKFSVCENEEGIREEKAEAEIKGFENDDYKTTDIFFG